MAETLLSPRVVAMRLVTVCRNPLAEKRASHPHPVSQAQSVERRQPVNADCFRMGPEAGRLAPSAPRRQVLHFQPEGSLKAPFTLCIQALKTAGKRTC